MQGLQDESATCVRLTLSGLKHCLPSLLQSSIPLQASFTSVSLKDPSLVLKESEVSSSVLKESDSYGTLRDIDVLCSIPPKEPEIPSSKPSEETHIPTSNVEEPHVPSMPSKETQIPTSKPFKKPQIPSSISSEEHQGIVEPHLPSCVPLLETLLHLSNQNTYWLNQIKLIELLSILPYHTLPSNYQRSVLNDIVLGLLTNEDVRVRNALADNLEKLFEHVYPEGKLTRCHGDGRCHGSKRRCFHGDDASGCHGNTRCSRSACSSVCLRDDVTSSRCQVDDKRISSCDKVLNESRNESGLVKGRIEIVGEVEKDSQSEREIGKMERRNEIEVNEFEGTDEMKLESKGAKVVQCRSDKTDELVKKRDLAVDNTKDENSANVDVKLSSDRTLDVTLEKGAIDEDFCDSKPDNDQKVGEKSSRSNKNCRYANNSNNTNSSVDNQSSNYKLDFQSHVDYYKLKYICSRDLSSFQFLNDSMSRSFKCIKLEMFIDMFHNVLRNEVRSLESKKFGHIPSFHLINGCIELLNKLSELYPVENYSEVWLQYKYVGSSDGLIVLLSKYLFSNHSNNIDLTSHCSVLNLLVRILVNVDQSSVDSVDSKLSVTILTSHMVKALAIVANVVNESAKFKTNTLKKNLEKISPIKNFTKDKIQNIASPKALHLPVTSFLAQPILSHVAVNIEILSPLKEDDSSTSQVTTLNDEIYSKFYDAVSNTYNNHKNNLKFDTDFSNFLSSLLDNLSRTLQVMGHDESKFIINDLSSSLSVVMNIEPSASIKCVYYALKSVFYLTSDHEIVNKQEVEKRMYEQVITAGKNESVDKLGKVSANSGHSPYDIFEPSVLTDATSPLKPSRTQSMETLANEEPCPASRNKPFEIGGREDLSFYENCISKPLNKIRAMIENLDNLNSASNELHDSRKTEKKAANDGKLMDTFKSRYTIKKSKPSKVSPDAQMLSQYLRMFEPCIISLFKHYSSTSNVSLQVYVLKLLTYIIELGFNYYNIDPDLAFVQILIKQFELFEHGYVKSSEVLLPAIVKFLLTLCIFGVEKSKSNVGTATNEKGKKEAKLGSGSSLASSKVQDDTIISINKIIHICDELYASGQNLQLHCIPGLKHVVKYIFIDSNHSRIVKKESLIAPRQNSVQDKDLELDTQQEVLFMNLLKLVHYPEVVYILSQILPESNGDSHQRRCSDVYFTLIRNLEFGSLTITNFTHIDNVLSLFNTLSPNVFEVDTLLSILFKLTDFNEQNFVQNVSSVVLLLSTVFKRYSLEDIFESIVRKKYTSFSLDWNTEVDPLHVSITLEATTVEPETELSKLLLYLLYQTVTSYNALAQQSRSAFVSQLTLSVILMYEHIIEKFAPLKTNLVQIICEEKRKNNNFFCDLGGHFQGETSVLLYVNFTRLTTMLRPSSKDVGSVPEVNFKYGKLEVVQSKVHEGQPLKNTSYEDYFTKQYKDVLNLLVSLDVSYKSKDNTDKDCETTKNSDKILKSKLLQLVALQKETPVHIYLLKTLYNNPNLCSQILEIFSHGNNLSKTTLQRLMLNSNTEFIGNFLNFLKTYFNFEIFSERILLLVGKHFLKINIHLGFHDAILGLLSLNAQQILFSNKCSVLSFSDISDLLISLHKFNLQCDLCHEMRQNVEHLINFLGSIQAKHFEVDFQNNAEESGSTFGDVNTEEWFMGNITTACHLPIEGTKSVPVNTDCRKLGKNYLLSFADNLILRNHLSNNDLTELMKKLNPTTLAFVVNHEQFNMKLLRSLMTEGKYMLIQSKDSKLLEVATQKMFDSVREFVKIVPDKKIMFIPLHRFPTEGEIEYTNQLNQLFLQNDVFNRYETLLDVCQEYFKTIDDLDVYLELQSDIVFNKPPAVRRNASFRDSMHSNGSFRSNEPNHTFNEAIDECFNPKEVLNKLKELNKQNSNEMFKFFLLLFKLLSYVIEKQNQLIRTKFDEIVNKIISTSNILICKFSFIFNILLKETEMDLNNIINTLYQCVSLYNNSLILTKHGNLSPSNSDSLTALFQLNTVLQLIIHESEVSIDNTANNEDETSCFNTDKGVNVTELFNLTLALCKCDALYTYTRVPLQMWEYMEPVTNLSELSLASLPTEMLLSVASLRDFILRLKYVGWNSRVHFEQTWVILLTILTEISNEGNEEDVWEDKSELYTLTIQGITDLLIQTQLVEPGNRKLDAHTVQQPSVFAHLNQYQGQYVHSSRNRTVGLTNCPNQAKIAKTEKVLFRMNQVADNALPVRWHSTVNYELKPNVYNVNQLSYNYLNCLLLDNEMNKDYLNEEDSSPEIRNEEYIAHVKKIKLINLDIQSCMHLLIDIYSQLLSNAALKDNVVESVLVLSDLFDNYQHYEWMYAKTAHSNDHSSDYAQALSLICATKSLCFIKIEHKKDKLNFILKKIVTSLNGHTKSEVVKLACIKSLFYLLENYVDKYIEVHNEVTDVTVKVNIADKIKNSHLLNKTLDLIYNLFKTNTTWNASVELETNFTSLCLYVIETFQPFSSYCNHTPLIETLNSIVDYLISRFKYHLNSPCTQSTARKLVGPIARLVSMYPEYEYLHVRVMSLCTDTVRKKKNHSVDIYTLFSVCIYNRYFTEESLVLENNVGTIEDVVDGEVNLKVVEFTETDEKSNLDLTNNEGNPSNKETCNDTAPTLTFENLEQIASTAKDSIFGALTGDLPSNIIKDPLENQYVENFFSSEKGIANVSSKGIEGVLGDHSKQLDEDDDSFYKMITSKQKSHQIKNFISDTIQNRKEKFKNLIKVKTNFDPLSNMLEKSTFYDKSESDVDETSNTNIEHEGNKSDLNIDEATQTESRKEQKQIEVSEGKSKTKFISYIETDRESTTTDDSDKDFPLSISKLVTLKSANNTISNSTTRLNNEDTSSAIVNYTVDDSFAIIELISLFLSRLKQLNQEEIKVISDKKDLSSNQVARDEGIVNVHKEVDILCEIICGIFLDFNLESDMLNRVVSEFFTVSKQNYLQLIKNNKTSIEVLRSSSETTETPAKNHGEACETKSNTVVTERITSDVKQTEALTTKETTLEDCLVNSGALNEIPSANFEEVSKQTFSTDVDSIDFNSLHVQTKLSHILLHVLKHIQIDLINDWVVSTLSNLFDLNSIQLTRYYLFVFLCYSCRDDLVRDYFVYVREPASLMIVARSFYNQLNDDLKRKFIDELTRVEKRLDGSEEVDVEAFRRLFESLFRCLGVKR